MNSVVPMVFYHTKQTVSGGKRLARDYCGSHRKTRTIKKSKTGLLDTPWVSPRGPINQHIQMLAVLLIFRTTGPITGLQTATFYSWNDLEPMFSLHSTCSSLLKQKFPEQAPTEAGKGRQAGRKIPHAKSQMQIREKTAVFGLQPLFFGIQCQMGI